MYVNMSTYNANHKHCPVVVVQVLGTGVNAVQDGEPRGVSHLQAAAFGPTGKIPFADVKGNEGRIQVYTSVNVCMRVCVHVCVCVCMCVCVHACMHVGAIYRPVGKGLCMS